jgi:hypothetical protein
MTATEHDESRGGREVRQESFSCDGPIEIDIRLGRGRVELRPSQARAVRIDIAPAKEHRPGEGPAAGREALSLERTRVSWSAEGRKLSIRSPREHRLRRIPLDVVVDAPAHSQLVVGGEGVDVDAAVTLHRLETRIGQGSVHAERVGVSTDARTGIGDVRLGAVSGRLRAATGAGQIEVRELESERAVLTAGHGDLRLGVVQGDLRARTGRGAIDVADAARGRLELVTGAGDVRVAIRPGIAAEVDLRSGSRRARSELPVGGPPSPSESPTLRVRAVSGSGEAVVTGAEPARGEPMPAGQGSSR